MDTGLGQSFYRMLREYTEVLQCHGTMQIKAIMATSSQYGGLNESNCWILSRSCSSAAVECSTGRAVTKCLNTGVHARVRVCVCVCVYTCIHMCVCAHVCMCVCVCREGEFHIQTEVKGQSLCWVTWGNGVSCLLIH